jgi:hypothetical protein
VSSDVEVPKHGIALFFRTAHHLRNVDALQALPPATPMVSDVKFSRKGYGGGPGYDGVLPRGLSLVFALDEASIKQVACGLSWTL